MPPSLASRPRRHSPTFAVLFAAATACSGPATDSSGGGPGATIEGAGAFPVASWMAQPQVAWLRVQLSEYEGVSCESSDYTAENGKPDSPTEYSVHTLLLDLVAPGFDGKTWDPSLWSGSYPVTGEVPGCLDDVEGTFTCAGAAAVALEEYRDQRRGNGTEEGTAITEAVSGTIEVTSADADSISGTFELAGTADAINLSGTFTGVETCEL